MSVEHSFDLSPAKKAVFAGSVVSLSSLACKLTGEGFMLGSGFVASTSLFSGVVLGPILSSWGKDNRVARSINTAYALGGAAVGIGLSVIIPEGAMQGAIIGETIVSGLIGITWLAGKLPWASKD